MWMLGPIGFTAPWLLLGLMALPVIWLILRAVPPAPIRRRFPGVALLLGLKDEEVEAARTPWWLLVLRLLALAAAIIGFAGPILNPQRAVPGQGPLLIVVDGSWASARDWPRRIERMTTALQDAQQAGRPAAVISLADPPPAQVTFSDAGAVLQSLPGTKPEPWAPQAFDTANLPEGGFETLWLSDGLARDSRAPLLQTLESHGPVKVWQPQFPVLALGAARIEDGALVVPAYASAALPSPREVAAIGRDPAGIERELAREPLDFADKTATELRFDLPPELRNRISRIEITGARSAGAVSLTDDAVKRRKVAILSAARDREGLELLSPTHYLHQALGPTADLIEGTLADVLTADPDVIILADMADLPEQSKLQDWVEKGGLLIRFAGPRMANSDLDVDTLLPVQLRAGGRSLGGTMSWGDPRALAPFPEGSPFAGLVIPEDVTVKAQVMAEPAPDLSEHTIAALTDGTPLVTRAKMGQGAVVLFHVTANAEWSSLPLSLLFPQMLERLAVSARQAAPEEADLAGQTWVPQKLLDGFGRLQDAGDAPGVPGEDLAKAVPGPKLRPGIYTADDRSVALNALPRDAVLSPATWPASVPVEGAAEQREMPLKGWLLAAALAALLIDILATLALSGKLWGPRAMKAAAMIGAMIFVGLAPPQARAEMDPARAIEAASNVVLAAMPTGDPEIDRVSMAGLTGLSGVLNRRTTVEPSEPMMVDLKNDDLAVYTFIYWPITADQPAPSPLEYAKLNRYLRGGGMILFDTRDADIAGFGEATPAGKRLQALAAPLDIPPLAPIPDDHVLTRTFYLLQDFPGRYDGTIWVEAPPADAERAEGMPFRNLNDGVTPVVIGGNDWAGAWAIDARGMPMFPVGRGRTGERQREIADRFGVNLVMHVLTGNYKSDQVHVPALLERLGQ
jgi:N-terminal double-transmembrane domain